MQKGGSFRQEWLRPLFFYGNNWLSVRGAAITYSCYCRSQYPAVWDTQRLQIDQAAKTLAENYATNVFPAMNLRWGTHPNNIGHNDSPGCFRCHDGNHSSKAGATS